MNFLSRQFEFKSKIAVIGDSILDEYYEVSANRVSPEFPIPVLATTDKDAYELALGGASNVCSQLSNFNFDVSLFSLINEKLKYIASNSKINTDGCIFSKSVPVKRRFYNNGFPLCRLDIENPGYNLDSEQLRTLQKKIFDNFLSKQPFDVVVFSDYNKGLFFNIENLLNSINENTITIVDPKTGPLDRWVGCTIIKPNAEEAKQISGKEKPKDQCEYFLKNTKCQAVIITNGGDGVFGNVMGNWFEYEPESKKSAISVIGAGDCFIAFLAMCMAHSIDIKEAVKISFDACSIYVNNVYNRPLYPYQIEESKFVSPKSLINRNFTLSFVNGCFDILHSGHLELFKFAKSKADKLVVALNSNQSVLRQNKKHPMVNDIEERKAMIASLEAVDFVLVFEENTPYELIKQIKPNFLVAGNDWPEPVGADIVDQVFTFDKISGYSSTNIIEKICSLMAK